MNKLIMITGDLATGKSTYSKLLGEKFKIEVFNKDNLKEILGDDIGFTNREENLKLSLGSVDIMKHIFVKFASCNHDLILEANFHKKELEDLQNLANNFNYDLLILNFTADIDTLYKRFVNRIENENRHKVHLTCGMDTYEEFISYIEKSRKDLEGIDKIINIDANDFLYQNDENLFNMINDFLK